MLARDHVWSLYGHCRSPPLLPASCEIVAYIKARATAVQVKTCAARARSSGAVSISHVLAAMGLDVERCRGSIRMTLGWTTTDAEVDRVLDVMPDLVRRLRGR